MTKDTSNKITFLSFICIIMVVFIHSSNLPYTYNGSEVSHHWAFAHFIEIFLSGGIARIAVPFFFVISGYLFFINIRDTEISVWFPIKLKSRSVSVMVPYLLWSILWLAAVLLLPAAFKHRIQSTNITSLINIMVFDPINGQMWYLLDLMILTVISPLLYILINTFGTMFIVLVICVWILGINQSLGLDMAICFFSIGGFISIHNDKSQYYASIINKRVNTLLTMFGLGIIANTAYTYVQYHDLQHYENIFLRCIIPIGIMGLWFCDRLYRTQLESFSKMVFAKMAFLIFVAHAPTVRIIGARFIKLFGPSELSALLAYFLAPVITISLVVIVGMAVKRRATPIYLVLTGGR